MSTIAINQQSIKHGAARTARALQRIAPPVLRALRLLVIALARHIVLPLLRRFPKQITVIGIGLFLALTAPQVFAIAIAVLFIILALKWAVKR